MKNRHRATSSSFASSRAGHLAPLLTLSSLALLLLVLFPGQAWALQTHGPPEGLYVHQMAHIHFILALAYLYWDIKRSSFPGRGWRYLRAFCILMLTWNIVAFIGHIATGALDADAIISGGGYLQKRIATPLDPLKVLFFMTKMDHLLAVPALFFLYLCMRTLYRSVDKDKGGPQQ